MVRRARKHTICSSRPGKGGRSTELVYGGARHPKKTAWDKNCLRYQLVKKASKEHRYLLLAASPLSAWAPIIIPINSWWDARYSWAGMGCYDMVTGIEKIERLCHLTKSKPIGPFAKLKQPDLFRTLGYYDGRTTAFG